MGKYIIFAAHTFYPCGGMNDVDSVHDTEESKNERLEALLKENIFDIIHVLDLENFWTVRIK